MSNLTFVRDKDGFLEIWDKQTGEFGGIMKTMGIDLDEAYKREKEICEQIKSGKNDMWRETMAVNVNKSTVSKSRPYLQRAHYPEHGQKSV